MLKPVLLELDKEFLADATHRMSAEEKKQLWDDYCEEYARAYTKEPISFKQENAGRFAANTMVLKRVNFRKELRQ